MIQFRTIGFHHTFDLLWRNHVIGKQTFCIQGAGSGMAADLLVHHGLGYGGFIGFIVSLAPVAYQVNNHVLVEMIAVIQRQAGDKNDCLRIITIYMEYGRLDHFCHVRAIVGGAAVHHIAGGETDLVVDYDMHGAAGSEPGYL